MDFIIDRVNHNIRKRQLLRVRAFGNLDGWFYSVHSADEGQLLGRDFGPLPSGFPFNSDTALLFSLAQAQRHIAKHFPDSCVVMVCTAVPSVQTKRRRAA